MKKIICILLFVLCLTGCAKQEPKAEPAIPKEMSTIGDAILAGIDDEYYGYEISEDYIRVVNDDYVCEATLTKELQEKLDAVDFFAEDKDQQYAEILKDLPIEKMEPRSASALTEDEMKQLIGKKGQDILDLGYSCYGYNLSEENGIFFIEKDGYCYQVVVEEHVIEEDTMDTSEVFSQCTIKEFKTE